MPASGATFVSGGTATLTVNSGGGTSCTWAIQGGVGNIVPGVFSCSVQTPSFLVVSAIVSNRCGSGNMFSFPIGRSGARLYQVSPNPSKEDLAITFDVPESADYMTSATLYDDKGKAIHSFDGVKAKEDKYFKTRSSINWKVNRLAKGTYFLHVAFGKDVFKSQILID